MFDHAFTLSVVVPCYNEEKTLAHCMERLLAIRDDMLSLEILIVDDRSTDASLTVARELAAKEPAIRVLAHERNMGKGAALRTGFANATGDFVAIQDADLEYDPQDLRRLVKPLVDDEADVVFGSRYLKPHARRVLHFWHSLMNKGLTFLSNLFTDLDLTDMETCYKLFRREVIQSIDLREERFGFEPEVTAKVAQMRLRVYEMAVAYHGRTTLEGKKINWKDGLRALYCILRYSAHKAPVPIQFLVYLFIGGACALANLVVFWLLSSAGAGLTASVVGAFVVAAAANYLLCITLLFRHGVRWGAAGELAVYAGVVAAVGLFDLTIMQTLVAAGASPTCSKITADLMGLALNFAGRRYIVFPEPPAGPWRV
ncbi:glycosyltransferase involved in cell wall biosynthesis [Desulfobaculum xiamenense]|uniref:Glycosyltransferase involved in cell wall biosynthesis n=1 Tax=Desulfobaculum xiamenense TaxID=995050 RepID=A0A846QPI2_9BACT|nr:glycosyltransferase family 2 protein [Desulfobaculum xiamenense]NJB68402.1 glycosyltransferase involved in cell wall biosynthesis [Desulfobaculum xiamenense]